MSYHSSSPHTQLVRQEDQKMNNGPGSGLEPNPNTSRGSSGIVVGFLIAVVVIVGTIVLNVTAPNFDLFPG